jgi:hypothetical protein
MQRLPDRPAPFETIHILNQDFEIQQIAEALEPDLKF